MDLTNKYLEEARHADGESKESELLAAELMTSTSGITSSGNRGSSTKSPAEYRRLLDTQALFAGGRQVAILHGNEEYMLRITKQGKLILTK